MLALVIVAGFSAGAVYLWREVGDRVLSSHEYRLTIDRVDITPAPDWIHADVRAEVFRDASLDRPLSIMDPELTEWIGTAFSLHPWVGEVSRVTKRYPARVEVELAWRRPVCMVRETSGRLLPVDVTGVLLPSDDFSPNEIERYPRLEGIETVPVGPAGNRWGDARVLGGAEIAAAFGPSWQQLSLDRIVPLRSGMSTDEEPTYELSTRGGTKIIWGRAPNTDMPGEVPAVDKVARLKKYRQEYGTLEGTNGPQTLDVRSLRSMRAAPRTAEKSVSPAR